MLPAPAIPSRPRHTRTSSRARSRPTRDIDFDGYHTSYGDDYELMLESYTANTGLSGKGRQSSAAVGRKGKKEGKGGKPGGPKASGTPDKGQMTFMD